MNVSLNPSYLCNFQCSFCYLTKDQLRDKKVASLDGIEVRLQEIIGKLKKKVNHIDLYGGEIALLEDTYLSSVLNLAEKYSEEKPSFITNLSIIKPIFNSPRIELSVSYDFDQRQMSEVVFNNIALLERDVSILILASKGLIEKDVDSMITQLNCLNNIISVEVKPYSSNQSNQQAIKFSEFEEFIQKWIDSKVEKKFNFVNHDKIKLSLLKKYSSFSDDHIYITPNNKFGILDFDKDDNEIFVELDSFEEYEQWSREEVIKVQNNQFCKECRYLGHCLTEHYREVYSMENSCNGFKQLLDWNYESIIKS